MKADADDADDDPDDDDDAKDADSGIVTETGREGFKGCSNAHNWSGSGNVEQ